MELDLTYVRHLFLSDTCQVISFREFSTFVVSSKTSEQIFYDVKHDFVSLTHFQHSVWTLSKNPTTNDHLLYCLVHTVIMKMYWPNCSKTGATYQPHESCDMIVLLYEAYSKLTIATVTIHYFYGRKENFINISKVNKSLNIVNKLSKQKYRL